VKFYELVAKDRARWPTTVAKGAAADGAAPFDIWRSSPERVRY
jgi:hypothetical protein